MSKQLCQLCDKVYDQVITKAQMPAYYLRLANACTDCITQEGFTLDTNKFQTAADSLKEGK